MIGIIEDWLFNKIGISVNLNNITNNNIFKDGSLIFNILQKHGFLDVNFQSNITSSSDKLQCLQNLKKFKPVFDMLDIIYDENVMLHIVEGNNTVIYKILYELYVRLENKQHLYDITCENNDRKKDVNCSGFNKIKCLETPVLDNRLQLENTLSENKDVIDWYRNKYNVVKHNMDLRILRLKNQTLNMVDFKQTKNKRHCGCIDSLYVTEKLPDLDDISAPKADHDKLLSYEDFIASYKEKQWQNTRKKHLEKDMHHYLLEQTWNKIRAKQEEQSSSVFSELLLKQSNYEKQMVTKLIQTQQQVKLQSDYKIKVNTDISSAEETHVAVDDGGFKELEILYTEEKKRVQELHKKLYKEKQVEIKKRHYSLCHDIISELLNIAVLASKFKELYDKPVPKGLWSNWMQMFFKGQNINIPLQQLECEVMKCCEENYDEIIHSQQIQDDILNANDIDEYLLTCGKWYYKDICLERNNFNNNIVAYVVYRLLSIKYPPPPSPLPADIPRFKIAGVLSNLNNTKITEKLNGLLSKQRVHVFNPEMAIKKCIDIYKEETIPDIEKSSKKDKSRIQNESLVRGKNSKSKRKSKSKTDNKMKKTDEHVIEETNEKTSNLVNKETQTSLTVPSDDEKLPIKSLGKTGEKILNTLKDGEEINDDMMVSVIIEYLKSLEGIEGWVLVDFPNSLTQASSLELALSGKHLPLETYATNEMKIDQDFKNNQQNNEIKSKIVILPDMNLDIPFKTYFSNFIKVKTNGTEEYEENKELYKHNLLKDDFQTMIRNEDKENERESLDMLEIFYKDQSIFREFYLEDYDFKSLKQLAEVILEVDKTRRRGSTDLLGEFSQQPCIQANNAKKSSKSISTNQTATNKKKKDKDVLSLKQLPLEKGIIKKDSKNSLTEDQTKMLNSPLVKDFQTKVVFPGEEEHNYISLPIDNELAKILATIWENIETQYLSNLTDLFFENRTINSRVVPYSKYIKQEIGNIRHKPDMRQHLISDFQEKYNSIQSDHRAVSQVKCQLHCKVFELQQYLWKITDDIKDETEFRRQEVIKENWLANEICLLINNYLLLIQTEFNKSLEILKLLNYYYLSMLGRNLPESIIIPHGEFNVRRLNIDTLLEVQDDAFLLTHSKSFNKSKDGSLSSEGSRINFITNSLVYCQKPHNTINLLKNVILHESELAKSNFQHVINYFYNQIQTDILFAPSEKRTTKEKSTYNNKIKHSKQTGSSKSVIGKPVMMDNSVKEVPNIQLLADEWRLALDSEKDNFSMRLNLIEARAGEDISEFYCYLRTEFCDLYHSNLKEYNNGISNINKICDLFKSAIEEETVLHHTLVLTNENFIIKTCENFVNNKSYNIKRLVEDFHNCNFTIHQLENLKEVFKIAGPNGVIGKKALCYIFKDLAISNDKDNQPYLPTVWSQLSEFQLIEIMDSLFGPEYEVDWRDFIIYNLKIPFPKLEDVLSLRNKFLSYDLQGTEIVSKDQYEDITLWFEEDLPFNPQECLRLVSVKQFLFELFQVKEKYIKYTTLLFYFCKDFDPKHGLRKALSLSIGRNVITNKEELDGILKEENEILKIVRNLLSDIVNSIVQDREGVIIFEVDDDTEFLDLEERASFALSLSADSKAISEEKLSKKSSVIINNNEQEGNGPSTFQDSLSFTEEHLSNKSWVSKIPVAIIESVLNTTFHYENGNSIVKLYVDILKDEANSDGTIEGYILMSSNCIKKLFAAIKKFTISLPCDIIQQHLQTNN